MKWLVLCFICAISLAYAEDEASIYDMSLEELFNVRVSTPSSLLEKLSDSPGIISVINKRQINAYGATTLAEIIELSTSAFISSSYMFPGNAISIRGDIADQYNVRVLLLLDGRPVTEAQNGGTPFAKLNAFPIQLIKQIEIIRGPGSVLYGSGAYAGVVNIVTLEPTDVRDLVALEKGSHNASRVSLYKSQNFAEWHWLFGLQYHKDDGWSFDAIDEVGTAFSRTYDRDDIGLFTKLKNQHWIFTASHADSTIGHVGTLPISSLFAQDADIRSKRTMLDIGYNHQSSEHSSLHINFTFNRLRNDYINPGPQPSYMYAQDYLAEIKWQTSLFDKLGMVVGASAQKLTGRSAGFHLPSATQVSIIPNYDELWLRSYLELSSWLRDDLKVVAGFQANKPEDIDINFSKRLSSIYQFSDHLGLKVQYAEAFRSASLLEKSIDLPGIVVGEADLKPEVQETYDVQFFYRQQDYNLAVTFYRSESTSLITRVPDATLGATYINDLQAIKSKGLELEGKWRLMQGIMLDYSFVWQKNKKNGDTHPIATPEKIYKLGITAEPSAKISGGIFAFYTADWGEPSGAVRRNPKADDFLLLKAKLSYHFNEDIEFFISGNNLLNEKIYQPEYVRGRMNTLPARDGITLLTGVRFQF